MKDKKFLALSLFFFLLFFLGISAVTLEKPISQILRASSVNPSATKSFVIVYPQIGSIGDQNSPNPPTRVKVTVYIRDVNGTVIPNRSVKLSTSLSSILISPANQLTTDSLGMAQFFLSSNAPGIAKLTAVDVTSNMSIQNIPTVEFTQ